MMGFWEVLGAIVLFNIVCMVVGSIWVLVTQSHELPTKEWRQKYKEYMYEQKRKRG